MINRKPFGKFRLPRKSKKKAKKCALKFNITYHPFEDAILETVRVSMRKDIRKLEDDFWNMKM